jgi:hypothetical protein
MKQTNRRIEEGIIGLVRFFIILYVGETIKNEIKKEYPEEYKKAIEESNFFIKLWDKIV